MSVFIILCLYLDKKLEFKDNIYFVKKKQIDFCEIDCARL